MPSRSVILTLLYLLVCPRIGRIQLLVQKIFHLHFFKNSLRNNHVVDPAQTLEVHLSEPFIAVHGLRIVLSE